MAEQVQITGTQSEGKIRNPLGVIGLTLITLGIYGLVWYYKINKEMAEMGKARNTEELGTSPGTSLMAVLFGWIIIVPPFVSTYKTCKRLNNAEAAVGREQGMEAPLLWLIYIFIWPIGAYILQANLNKVLETQAAQAPGTPAPQIDAPEAAVAPAEAADVAPAERRDRPRRPQTPRCPATRWPPLRPIRRPRRSRGCRRCRTSSAGRHPSRAPAPARTGGVRASAADGPHDLGQRGQSVADLLEAVLAQGTHALGDGDLGDPVDRGTLHHQGPELVGDLHHLVEPDAALVAGLAAAHAPDRFEHLDLAGAGRADQGARDARLAACSARTAGGPAAGPSRSGSPTPRGRARRPCRSAG